MKILFENVRTLDGNGQAGEHMYVGVDGKKITYIGITKPDDAYDRVINGNGNLLVPAFCNAHCHAAMTLFRGYGEDLPLDRWLNERIFPAEDRLNYERVYTGSMLAAAEMIRNGIVSLSDMYMFTDATADVVIETGMKANLSRSIVLFEDRSDYSDNSRVREALEIFDKYNDAGEGRLKIDMSLHAEYTNKAGMCSYVAKLAAEKRTGIQIHLSETEKEQRECIGRNGVTPAEFFERLGVFDVPATAAHCVYVTDRDIDILKEKKVTVAHCPVSNLKLGSGVMPYAKLHSAGVNIALGTDGAASENTLDMIKEMQTAAILHKGITHDPTVTTAADMQAMTSRNGFLSQGRQDCGLMKEGYRADLVLIDMNSLHNIPSYGSAESFTYSVSSSDVLITMCDGRILYENGTYTLIDTEKLRADCERVIGSYFD